jgi:hypothetical protein
MHIFNSATSEYYPDIAENDNKNIFKMLRHFLPFGRAKFAGRGGLAASL